MLALQQYQATDALSQETSELQIANLCQWRPHLDDMCTRHMPAIIGALRVPAFVLSAPALDRQDALHISLTKLDNAHQQQQGNDKKKQRSVLDTRQEEQLKAG